MIEARTSYTESEIADFYREEIDRERTFWSGLTARFQGHSLDCDGIKVRTLMWDSEPDALGCPRLKVFGWRTLNDGLLQSIGGGGPLDVLLPNYKPASGRVI